MSATTSINNAASSNGQNASTELTLPTQQLSEQDFLNLLVTQMTEQDPLDPMTNEDMVDQMVQFSTLQSNTNMQSLLTGMQTNESFSEASSLIGMQVSVQTDSNGDTTQGVVSGVNVSSGTPEIIVNGQAYNVGQVISVSPPANTSTSSTNQ
jgi:flagellar basal-body rod modification protein FlgD